MLIGVAGWAALGGAALSASEGSKNRKAAAAANAANAENAGPWKPAVPYMEENLRAGGGLRDFYRQNPHNAQQRTSYQNIFGDLDNFRQNTAPGLMGFANNAMNSSYERQRGGDAGSGAGYGGAVQRGGLLRGSQTSPFSVNQGGQYGLLDFNAQNQFTNGGVAPEMLRPAPAPVAPAPVAPVAVAPSLWQPSLDDPGGSRYGHF